MNKNIIAVLSVLILVVLASVWLTVFYKQGVDDIWPSSPNNTFTPTGELRRLADAQEIINTISSQVGLKEDGMVPTIGSSARAIPEDLGSAENFASSLDQSYSTTNVQVKGVDEADIVKTDGDYLYLVTGRSLVIVSAEKEDLPATMVSQTDLKDSPTEIYIHNDKLVVYGSAYDQSNVFSDRMIMPWFGQAFVEVYSIADRQAPSLEKRFDFEGNYFSSRLIDNHLYFITVSYGFYPSEEKVLPAIKRDGEIISSNKTTEDYLFPGVYYLPSSSGYEATTVSVLNLDNLSTPFNSQVYFMPSGHVTYVSEKALYLTNTEYFDYYSLRGFWLKEALFDLLGEKEQTAILAIEEVEQVVLSDQEKSYKIGEVIDKYFRLQSTDKQIELRSLAENYFKNKKDQEGIISEKTSVHKIEINGDELSYTASGFVPGRLLNQFSVDEFAGFLRLATTLSPEHPFSSGLGGFGFDTAVSSEPPDSVINLSSNQVYIMNEDLVTVGLVENLAPGEQIYSVRFMGEKGYVVTFEQIDPLFVLDLSDPYNPKVTGELKIPGFSSYLHPYKENILIGVGREVEVGEGNNPVVKGLKLSLFNIADMSSPQEVFNMVLGGPGSESPVIYDHKAFLLSAERDLLFLPVSLTNEGGSYEQIFQGIIVYEISESGLRERGRIEHNLLSSRFEENNFQDDTARRALYIGNYAYSLSPSFLRSVNLLDLSLSSVIELPFEQNNLWEKPLPRTFPIDF